MISVLGMGFIMGWVGSMPMAGAVSIFVFQRGLAGRFRPGLVLAAGAASAEAVWCLVALIGAEQILTRWPNLEGPARTISGFILVALGLYILFLNNPLPGTEDERAPGEVPTLLREFWLGFVLVAGNISIPFTWLGMITLAVSWGLDPVAGPPWLFASGVVFGIVGWFALLLRILAVFRTRFQLRTHKLLMKAIGILPLAVGALTLFKTWF